MQHYYFELFLWLVCRTGQENCGNYECTELTASPWLFGLQMSFIARGRRYTNLKAFVPLMKAIWRAAHVSPWLLKIIFVIGVHYQDCTHFKNSLEGVLQIWHKHIFLLFMKAHLDTKLKKKKKGWSCFKESTLKVNATLKTAGWKNIGLGCFNKK